MVKTAEIFEEQLSIDEAPQGTGIQPPEELDDSFIIEAEGDKFENEMTEIVGIEKSVKSEKPTSKKRIEKSPEVEEQREEFNVEMMEVVDNVSPLFPEKAIFDTSIEDEEIMNDELRITNEEDDEKSIEEYIAELEGEMLGLVEQNVTFEEEILLLIEGKEGINFQTAIIPLPEGDNSFINIKYFGVDYKLGFDLSTNYLDLSGIRNLSRDDRDFLEKKVYEIAKIIEDRQKEYQAQQEQDEKANEQEETYYAMVA